MATPTAEPPQIAIAQVGHTGTDSDRDRWLAARLWLERSAPDFFARLRCATEAGMLVQDCLDLHGEVARDFLAEDNAYDVVLTHHLWGSPELPAKVVASEGTDCSPLHSPAAWRRRLRRSGASYVFLFGPHFHAANLDSAVPGYVLHEVQMASRLSVFVAEGQDLASVLPAIGYRDLCQARLNNLPELTLNRVLDLSFTSIEANHLLWFKKMKELVELSLVSTSLADSGLAHVAELPSLRRLILDRTKIGGAGFKQLHKLAQLQLLSLNHTSMDDSSLESLLDLSNLEWLSLVGTAISDVGLVRLRSLKRLRSLSVVCTDVTMRGVCMLQDALPDCAINSFPLGAST